MLRVLSEISLAPADVVARFPRYQGVETSCLVDTLLVARWATPDIDGSLVVTASGQHLLMIDCPIERLRTQLWELLDILSPPWAAAAAQGRSAFAGYLTREMAQCFRESGLLGSNAPEVVAWWDALAFKYRNSADSAKVEVGRHGERLSYEYELHRTSFEPQWVALEYSDAGYDILSRVSQAEQSQLLIEVKASRLPWGDAEFFLTRHEWKALLSSGHAQLHLWTIIPPVCHAVIPCDQVLSHLPSDSGSGEWKLVTVPFAAFTSFAV